MAAADSASLLGLRALACGLGGITAGVLLAVPVLAVPSLFACPHLLPKTRLHVWSRLQADTTAATSILLPLLAALLASCALLVESSPPIPRVAAYGSVSLVSALVRLVVENRKTFYAVSASLIIASRPFSFGLLAPRIEVLAAEERRFVLDRARAARSRSSLGLSAMEPGAWKGASPTREYAGWVAQQEREAQGDESDVEDNDLDEATAGAAVDGAAAPLDTDTLILELTRLQHGTAVLAGTSFVLTVIELVCA
ncbi:hypothetical protein JCM3775_001753 [Rhodotorula graminis]